MRLRLLFTTAAVLGLLAAPAFAGPFATVWGVTPGVDPPGVNVAGCKPRAAHPEPVVLVHGTWMDRSISWNVIGPALAQQGYCVYSIDYGRRGTQPVANSAKELATFVDQILAVTGAPRVSIVGHSQGGMMPREYVKFDGGLSKVDDLIGIAPSNHGSDGSFGSHAAQYGDSPAAADQEAGSPFLTNLNAGDETPQPATGPGISYTVLETSHDEIVTPFTSAFLSGSAGELSNVLLQDKCPGDTFEHIALTDDPVVLQWVENALASPGPADPSFTPIGV
jgi:triacylglycerol lipase